jgi:hypothetical protein
MTVVLSNETIRKMNDPLVKFVMGLPQIHQHSFSTVFLLGEIVGEQ